MTKTIVGNSDPTFSGAGNNGGCNETQVGQPPSSGRLTIGIRLEVYRPFGIIVWTFISWMGHPHVTMMKIFHKATTDDGVPEMIKEQACYG